MKSRFCDRWIRMKSWNFLPRRSNLSSLLASRLSFLSCRSISAFIRFCSFCSSDRQHAILSAKVSLMHCDYSSQAAAAAATTTLHKTRMAFLLRFRHSKTVFFDEKTPFERGRNRNETLEGRLGNANEFFFWIMTHTLEKKVGRVG